MAASRLTDADLLDVWERGYGRAPWRQALLLLGAAAPVPPAELARLTVGRRDAELLRLRRRLFGVRLETITDCPACRKTLEVSLAVEDILHQGPPPAAAHELRLDGYRIEFRLPNSLDLAALAGVEPAHRRQWLLAQCIQAAERDQTKLAADDLPPEIVAALAEALSQADPQANVQLALSCADCGHQWQTPLDIVSFLWTELNAWAERLLAQIHLLASAYGWSEGEILSLGAWRRQAYLNMVRQ
jgi:hypothetical protein